MDIFHVFQCRVASQWVDIPDQYNRARDYELFSWLTTGGGDRMGTCCVQPLSSSSLRGFPADFELVEERWHPTPLAGIRKSDTHPGCVFMGESGESWLLSDEILQAIAPKTVRTVRTPRNEFDDWDWSEYTPWQWATANFGHTVGEPDNVLIGESEVLAQWNYDFTEDFAYFVDEVRRLAGVHGQVRFVFAF
ncbi:MAG: hypothetical protein HEQ39_02995 [Rhizobacter sp.]